MGRAGSKVPDVKALLASTSGSESAAGEGS